MEIGSFVFYFFAAMAVLSATYIFITKNVVFAAFSLVVTFLSVAAIYVLSTAEFVAMTQLIIYVGGIVVLIIFGVMLTNKTSGKAYISGSHFRIMGALASVALFVLLSYAILQINFSALTTTEPSTPVSNTTKLGIGMMSKYLLLFEISAIVLLIALIGAASIASFKPNKK